MNNSLPCVKCQGFTGKYIIDKQLNMNFLLIDLCSTIFIILFLELSAGLPLVLSIVGS